jgi:hypothetical protein
VSTSTDKAENTVTIECKNWWTALCLRRLTTEAFEVLESSPETVAADQLDLVEMYTPWAADWDFSPAILFGTAKQHKRHEDPLAERYITSACSAWSNPLSNLLTKILTAVSNRVREHCVQKGDADGGKYWWAIDSLDTVPLNIDLSHRPDRKPSAFDLEKAFECIVTAEGPYSLVNHVEFFLEIGLPADRELVSSYHWAGGPGDLYFVTAGHGRYDCRYSALDILDMLRHLLSMATIAVGDTWARQHVGIPMGYSSSVCLLNIYMFKPEYLFVQRVSAIAPMLLPHTRELYRYVDDLLNLSDLDITQFLDALQPQHADNLLWIYPLAPNGPLGIN